MVQQNSASESTINKSENTHDPKKQVMIEYEFLERMFDLTGKQVSDYDPNSKEAKIIRKCFAIIDIQVDQIKKIGTVLPNMEKTAEQKNREEIEYDFVEKMFNFGDTTTTTNPEISDEVDCEFLNSMWDRIGMNGKNDHFPQNEEWASFNYSIHMLERKINQIQRAGGILKI